MRIVYSQHLQRRLAERQFPSGYPRKVVETSKLKFFDNATGHWIAISKLKYANKLRSLAVSYDIIGETIEIITILPITDGDIQRRRIIKRWQKK